MFGSLLDQITFLDNFDCQCLLLSGTNLWENLIASCETTLTKEVTLDVLSDSMSFQTEILYDLQALMC